MTKKIKYISPDAKTYADACIELGFTIKDIETIEEIFDKVPELSKVLMTPSVNPTEKRQLIDKVLVNSLQANFVKLLIDKGRLSLIFEILECIREIILSKKYIVNVKLSYVSMPTDLQISKMEQILKDKLHCQKINWTFEEDANLIGGFRLDAGDLFFDYSVRGRLDEMKNKITGR